MIGFLSPIFLLAGAAAAVPLAIHLLRKRSGARVEFPAARYLARAEREHSRRLRMRNLLLMLLRVAAVLILALAAARPVAPVPGAGHAPTALALVLDNSLSTAAVSGGRPVLSELRERAASVLLRAGTADRLWLVTADGEVRGGSRATLLRALAGVEPLAGRGNPERALQRAAALVRSSALPEREVALLTDAQRTAWPAPVALADVRLDVFRPAAEAPADRAVVEAAAVPIRWTPRGAVEARFRTTDSITYRMILAGRTLARGSASAGERVVVRAEPAERGWVAGSVELPPDELRADDIRYFAAWIGAAPAVSVDPAAGPFAGSAVEALIQADRVAAGRDIVLAPAGAVARLPALVLAPADPVRLGAANRALERLGVPWRFGAPRRDRALASGAGLQGVQVRLRYPLTARGDASAADTLATVAGEAWAVAGPGYVLLASPLTPEASDLPVRAAFLPWLSEMLGQRLGGASGPLYPAPPGSSVLRPAAATALESESGERTPAAGDSVAVPARAGVYFFTAADSRVGAVVVNPESEELVLDRLDDAALRSRLRAANTRVVSTAAAWRRITFVSPARREAARPLLVLAAAALLAESLTTGAWRRRSA